MMSKKFVVPMAMTYLRDDDQAWAGDGVGHSLAWCDGISILLRDAWLVGSGIEISSHKREPVGDELARRLRQVDERLRELEHVAAEPATLGHVYAALTPSMRGMMALIVGDVTFEADRVSWLRQASGNDSYLLSARIPCDCNECKSLGSKAPMKRLLIGVREGRRVWSLNCVVSGIALATRTEVPAEVLAAMAAQQQGNPREVGRG